MRSVHCIYYIEKKRSSVFLSHFRFRYLSTRLASRHPLVTWKPRTDAFWWFCVRCKSHNRSEGIFPPLSPRITEWSSTPPRSIRMDSYTYAACNVGYVELASITLYRNASHASVRRNTHMPVLALFFMQRRIVSSNKRYQAWQLFKIYYTIRWFGRPMDTLAIQRIRPTPLRQVFLTPNF
jgi:hypothetical protein